MRAPGLIEPIVYWKNRDGRVVLAPYSSHPTPEGWMREEANTLPLARELEKRLQQQDKDDWEREAAHEIQTLQAKWKKTRSALYSQINSSAHTEYEKEFIRLSIAHQDEERFKHFNQRWLEQTSYLWALHNDTPKGREVDSEEYNWQHHEVKE